MGGEPRRHIVIPDTQIRPGVPTDHIDWIADYIASKKPDVIVCLGDWWDLASLNSHSEKGSAPLEGTRYKDDIWTGNEAFKRLSAPIDAEVARIAANRKKAWKPRKTFLKGNHEIRADRVINNDPKYEGVLSSDDCETPGWERHEFLHPVEIDGILYCMAPHHKILTSDLRWVSLGDVKIGQEIIAFDEHSPGPRKGRRFRTAKVLRKEIAEAELFDVRLSDGHVFTVTADHQWLCRKYNTTLLDWCRTDALTGWHETPRLFPMWQRGDRYEDGWFGGLIEGEGHITKPNCTQGGIQVGLAQNAGDVLERAKEYLSLNGFAFKVWPSTSGCMSIRILGPSSRKIELLARVGALRLINKLQAEMLGRVQLPDGVSPSRIVSVTPVGKGTIAKVQTSTGTMIVDGYPHHNCHYFKMQNSNNPIGGSTDNRLNKIGASHVQGHQVGLLYGNRVYPDGKTRHSLTCGSAYVHDEQYRGPQCNKHFRGICVLQEVQDGDFLIMPVSLDFLCRKATGDSLQRYHTLKYPSMNWGNL